MRVYLLYAFLLSLVAGPTAALAATPLQPPGTTMQVRSSGGKSALFQKLKGKLPRRHRKDLLTPLETLTTPPTPPVPVVVPVPTVAEVGAEVGEDKPKPPPAKPRPPIDSQGLVIGDFHIQPTLVFGTDNRYDDAGTRERALRTEMDDREAQRRGEIHTDPITMFLKNREAPHLFGGDPGFRLATSIRQILQLHCNYCVDPNGPHFLRVEN